MKRYIEKIMAVILSFVMIITVMQVSNVSAASRVKLNKKTATVYVGKTVRLKVKNNKKKVKWSSINKKIATVNSKGKVKGIKAGKTTIKAKVGKKTYKCRITVKKKKATKPSKVPQQTKPAEQPTTKPADSSTKDNVESVEDWIFKSTSSRCWIQEYVGNDTDIIIPDKINGKTVVGITDDAFKNVKYKFMVTLPNTITQISSTKNEKEDWLGNVKTEWTGPFINNKNLVEVTFSNSIKTIGDYAFSGCTNLKNVNFSSNVTSIGQYAFNKCTSIANIAIPNRVTNIGDYAFNECTGITNVTIPSSVTSIGEYAFNGCKKITGITIPNSVVYMEKCAFGHCIQLESVDIQGDKTQFNQNVFQGCVKLYRYDLKWIDDFNGTKLDMNTWTFETGGNGWGNNELENYTEGENYKIEDGKLVIIPRITVDKTSGNITSCTSTRIHTKDKANWKYGKIEIRAKATKGKETNPMVWMLGTDEERGWPYCGEIDMFNLKPNGIEQEIICPKFNGSWLSGERKYFTPEITGNDAALDYHTYAITWDETQIVFSVDDKITGVYSADDYDEYTKEKAWVFDKDFYMILNCAVGGVVAGDVTTEGWNLVSTIGDIQTWEDYFYIDYVKKYDININF